MQTITPFLWFNNKAEEAAKFYVSLFKDGKIVKVRRRGAEVMGVDFRISGRKFIAFNGGPDFKFTPALSLFVECKTQREVDHLWDKLSEGGEKMHCGWLKDKYGLSWQIIPSILGQLVFGKDPVKSERAFKAMLDMTRIDIQALKRARAKP